MAGFERQEYVSKNSSKPKTKREQRRIKRERQIIRINVSAKTCANKFAKRMRENPSFLEKRNDEIS